MQYEMQYNATWKHEDDTIFSPGVDGSGVNYYLYLTPIAFPDP